MSVYFSLSDNRLMGGDQDSVKNRSEPQGSGVQTNEGLATLTGVEGQDLVEGVKHTGPKPRGGTPAKKTQQCHKDPRTNPRSGSGTSDLHTHKCTHTHTHTHTHTLKSSTNDDENRANCLGQFFWGVSEGFLATRKDRPLLRALVLVRP